jgi:hypothetical protein
MTIRAPIALLLLMTHATSHTLPLLTPRYPRSVSGVLAGNDLH